MQKTDWTLEEIQEIYHRPILKLIFDSATVHRKNFNGEEIQVSSLISVKTGGCPEDCSYCPQSAHYQTGVKNQEMMSLDEVKSLAKKAKDQGASRVCLGAAWREVKAGKSFDAILEMVKEVSRMDMEVCCTLGMLKQPEAEQLKEAGLYAYNHNIDTSKDAYKTIIRTRDFKDRLDTLQSVRKAKITVCCGGILGMGESVDDRLTMLQTLSSLMPQPESVPINTLVPVKGTPLENQSPVPIWDLLRIIATARILMPKSFIRLSAGRKNRSVTDHALCFLAGANSIFAGDKLLVTPNREEDLDFEMFKTLNLSPKESRLHQ